MKHISIATQVRLALFLAVSFSTNGGCGAEPLEAGKAAEPAARAKELKAGVERFLLRLTHNAYVTDSSRSVALAGPEVLRGQSYNRYGTYIWLPAEAATRLIDHLHADGFLARALDANETPKTAPGWPSYTLTVGLRGGPRYRADLGWDEAAATYVDGLAKVLEEDSPKAVSALKAISANVRQRLAEAAKPEGGVPDDLARNLDSFFLHLQLVLEPAEVRKYKDLVLSVPAPSTLLRWDPNFYVSAQITEDDASRIVQHLAAKGFFTRCGTVRPFERKVLPHPHGPACVLNISSSQWGFSAENLGWCPETLRRLEALRGELRGDAAKAMDALVHRIAEDHPGWTIARATQPASKPAGDIPAAVEALIEQLKSPSVEGRSTAALRLGQLGRPAMPAADALAEAAKDENPQVHAWAIWALAKMRDRRAVEPILRHLKEPQDNPYVPKSMMFSTLEDIDDPRIVPAMIEALGHMDRDVRFQAATVLAKHPDERAVDPLIAALPDAGIMREPAVKVFVQVGPPAVKALMAATDKPSLRWEAILALGQMGPAAKDAVLLLIRALHDRRGEVREVAADALGEIRDPRAVDPLIAAYRAAPKIRRTAFERAKDLTSEVSVRIQVTPGGYLAENATRALVTIGPAAVPGLAKVLNDPDPWLREWAARTLGQVGSGAESALPALRAATQDKDESVSHAASEAIRNIAPAKQGDAPATSQKTQEPGATNQRADANALLAKVRSVLPEGWEATLYWSPEEAEDGPTRRLAGWLGDEWRRWLPGMDGRRIEVRRKEVVRYQVDAPGPDPDQSYVQDEEEYLRLALTLGSARQEEDIRKRLRELNKRIEELEVVLKPSFLRLEKDGYVRHTVPRNDKGRRTLLEYDKLWTTKRLFPQWSEGSLSVGFRSLIWLRMLPDGAKTEYRQVKEKVLSTLRPIRGWQYIPADEE